MRQAGDFVTWRRDSPVKLRLQEKGPLSETPVSVITVFRDVAKNYPDCLALGKLGKSVVVFCSVPEFDRILPGKTSEPPTLKMSCATLLCLDSYLFPDTAIYRHSFILFGKREIF